MCVAVVSGSEWNKIIAGWSRLYGAKVSGWWFDGCYHSYDLHDFADDDPPNFRVSTIIHFISSLSGF